MFDPSVAQSGLRFEHIGIVVKDLKRAQPSFARLLEIKHWTEEVEDPIQMVKVRFGRDAGGLVYELVAPTSEDSPVISALRRRVNLLNHVAYRTKNLDAQADRLKSTGCVPLGPVAPGAAFDGNRLQFFMSKLGVIIELIEQWEPNHRFSLVE